MAVTYFQRSDTSDLTGPTGTGGTTRHLVASRTAGGATFDLATGNMNAGLLCNQNFFTPAADPGLNGQVGNHTVVVRVTVQNVNIGIRVFLGRVNASGTLQGSEVQAAEGSQTAGAATRTFTWTAANLGIWQAGYRLRVRVELTNTSGSMNQSATIAVDTSDDTITTPFDDTAAGNFTVAVATSATTSDGTSHTVALPDGSNVSGRRVVVWFAKDGTTGTVTWPTSPAFTQFQSGNGTDVHLALAYRDIDGTEGFSGTGDTITVTTSASEQSNHTAYLISAGHDPATAPEAAATALGSDASPDPPSLTPTWGAAANLWIAGAGLRFNGQFTAAPTSYTNLLNGPAAGGAGDTNAPLGTARRELSATSENPGTFTQNGGSNNWVATVAAIRPAAAGTEAPAGTAASTGSANTSAVTIGAGSGAASSTGTANTPTPSIAAQAGVAAATGTAPQPTADTGGAATNAPAGPATATGAANPGIPAAGAQPAAPTAAGTANQAAPDIEASAGTATATGTAPGATVETGTFTNAPAGLAAATGTASTASTDIDALAAAATAAGAIPQSETTIGPHVGLAASTGTAPQAAAQFGAIAPAGLASAAGTAGGPSITLEFTAGTALAAGEAGLVFALTGNPLGPGQPVTVKDQTGVSITVRDQPVVEVT